MIAFFKKRTFFDSDFFDKYQEPQLLLRAEHQRHLHHAPRPHRQHGLLGPLRSVIGHQGAAAVERGRKKMTPHERTYKNMRSKKF